MTQPLVHTHRTHAPSADRSLLIVFVPRFLVILSVPLLGLLVGLHWKGWLPGAEKMDNVFSGTRAAVYTFLSHIS